MNEAYGAAGAGSQSGAAAAPPDEHAGFTVQQAGHVALLRLNRPQARNALSRALIQGLTAWAHAMRASSELRALVLSGGPAFFSAGVDLKESALSLQGQEQTLLQRREMLRAGPDLCQAFENMEAVTVAAIEGFCVGGGAAMALACDFRIMAEGSHMRLPEVPLGMNMSWRSLPRMVALVGPARAKRMALFGEAIDAATALAWGLCDEVVPAGQAEAAALRWAERAAALPPLPTRMTKEAVNAAANALHHATSVMDRDQFLLASLSEDLREGVAAFMEKRTPQFKGR